MKQNLEQMAVDELVDLYEKKGLEQDRVIMKGEAPKHKHLFYEMFDIADELRRRGLPARLSLTKLLDHPNFQVRLQAAKASLAVAPDAAREVIEAISKSRHFPQAGDAGMCLQNLDDGIFKPD